jgi:hypothetical protein
MSRASLDLPVKTRQWVPLREAINILGVGRTAISRLIVAGHLRAHQLPGGRRLYHLGDLLRIAPPAE